MEVVSYLKNFADSSGLKAAIVLVLTAVITNLVKIPVKKHSAKIATLAQKSGFDISESFINSMIVYIPFGVAFVLFCLIDGINAIAGGSFNIVHILAQTPLIATGSIGLYSIVTAAIEKASQNKEYKEYLKSTADTVSAEQPDADGTNSQSKPTIML